MDDNMRWHRRRLMEQASAALEKNGFKVALFDERQSALEWLSTEAAGAATVGIGGSMTLVELGLGERLEAAGKVVYSHSRPELAAPERRQVMQEQLGCEIFFTSTNALTVGGHLVNIDATGNRVGAMAFGPRKVMVVAGANKITLDVESALRRVREVACPPNARRLGFDTPCAKTGLCTDCNSPQRICRITTIIERRPRATDLQICLVNEDLGY